MLFLANNLSNDTGFLIGMAIICTIMGAVIIAWVIYCIIRVIDDDTYNRKKRRNYYDNNHRKRK